METDVAKIKEDEINTNFSLENLNTSVSLKMAAKSFYNVTPTGSQITNFEENSPTQSLTTLTDDAIINNNSISASRYSVNLRVNDTGNNLSHSASASGFLKELVESIYTNMLISTPEILFNAPKPKRHKKLRRKILKPTNRKSHKFALLVRHYIGHYKYKHPEKIIPRKYKTYFDKIKRNAANPSRVQQNLFCNSAVKAVSRSTNLKKVLAKENLFNEVDKTALNDTQQDGILEKDPSEDTLTRINSESSQNDSINTKTPPSVVEISNSITVTEVASTHTITLTYQTLDLSNQSHETYHDNNEYGKYHINCNTEKSVNQSSFKTEIEVALALNDASILKYINNVNSEQSRDETLYKENLTSAENFMGDSDIIKFTSSHDISETDTHNMNLSKNKYDKICIVINDMVNTFNNTSDGDTFVIAQTSSYVKNISDSMDISSEQTLTPSELTNQTEPCNVYCQSTSEKEVKPALLDTMTNEGMYQMPASYLSKGFSTNNFNNVIITDELRRVSLANREPTTNKNMRKVIQKSFSVDNDGDRPKNINLPNEDTIRSILEAKMDKKSCSEEFRNFIPHADGLDRLISYLNIAIKKMEDSLLKRIGNEIKRTLDKFDKFVPFMEERDFLKSDLKYLNTNKSDLSRIESGVRVLEEGVQCGLVRNEIIDELTKMKIEGETNIECPLQVVRSKIRYYEESFRILKPVEVPTSVEEQGDSYITSSSEGVRVKRLSKKSSILSYLAAPIHFVRKNILVLTSVPAFFMSIFLLYSFFLLLV